VTTETGKQSKRELIQELGESFRVSQTRSQAFDQLVAKRLGINLTDLSCLDVIQRRGRVTAGELAEELGLTTGAVTAILDRLEDRGYARRLRDQTDRRRVLVELTPEAERQLMAIYGPMAEEWYALLGRYTADQLRLMIDMMRRGEEVGWRGVELLRRSA
jgi:DNA-binding MarR family transcriptional regulator